MFYKVNENNVIYQIAYDLEDEFDKEGFIETDRNIVPSYVNHCFAFEDTLDKEAEAKAKAAQAEAEKEQAEAEALKPTVEDLQEALSILSDIVLGGTE